MKPGVRTEKMRALLQRVLMAKVSVDSTVISEIGRGILAYIGIEASDTAADETYIVNKVLSCRLFESQDGKAWGASAATLGLPLLVVSQFTLSASCKKPKPDFHRAMSADRAREVFVRVIDALRSTHPSGASAISTGQFQAMMQVYSVNDGPVTVLIDSKSRDVPVDVESGLMLGYGAAPASTDYDPPSLTCGESPVPTAAAGDFPSIVDAESGIVK